MLVFVVIVPFFPLLISRRWNWWEAWVFGALCLLSFVVGRGLAARSHPDLIAERARFTVQEEAKSWDKILAPLAVLGTSLIPLVAGLDAFYARSRPFILPAKVVSLVLIVAGIAWGNYALVENRFFSAVVRIQTERGHYVVSSGPYRRMRHPGYAGTLLVNLATPLFLDSLWAFLPAALTAIVLVIRTHLEDRTLLAELEGYRDYAKRVRFRLVPGIW